MKDSSVDFSVMFNVYFIPLHKASVTKVLAFVSDGSFIQTFKFLDGRLGRVHLGYSGVGILGIDGIFVLLGAIPLSE